MCRILKDHIHGALDGGVVQSEITSRVDHFAVSEYAPVVLVSVHDNFGADEVLVHEFHMSVPLVRAGGVAAPVYRERSGRQSTTHDLLRGRANGRAGTVWNYSPSISDGR